MFPQVSWFTPQLDVGRFISRHKRCFKNTSAAPFGKRTSKGVANPGAQEIGPAVGPVEKPENPGTMMDTEHEAKGGIGTAPVGIETKLENEIV